MSPRKGMILFFFIFLLQVSGEEDEEMDISFFINIFSSSSADFYLALDAIHDSMQEINHEKNVNYEIIGLLPERSILQSENTNSNHLLLRCTLQQQATKFTKKTGKIVTIIDQEASTPFISSPSPSPCIVHDIQLHHFWGSLPPSPSPPSSPSLISLSTWMEIAMQQSKGSALFFTSDLVTFTPNSILDLLSSLSPSPSSSSSSSSLSETKIVGTLLQSPSGKVFSAGIGLQMSARAENHWSTPTLSVAPFHIFGGGSLPVPDGLSSPMAVSHHCLVVGRDTFNQIGGFNMSFFPDFHDIDFCLRVKEKEKEKEKEQEKEIVKILSLPVPFSKETNTITGEKIPAPSCLSCENCEKMTLFEEFWREKLLNSIQESYQNDIRVIWTMECGAGQVRGFSDEAISFLVPLEKMISVHADVTNVDDCYDLLSSYPPYIQCGMQRMMRKPLPPSPPPEEEEGEGVEEGSGKEGEGENEEEKERKEGEGEREESFDSIPSPLFSSRIVNVIHKSPGSFEHAPGWVYQREGGEGEGERKDLFVTVGRCMYESHVIPKEWGKQIKEKRLSELWVPSVFNMYTFWRSGVSPSLLSLLQQGVDSSFFNPSLPHPSLRPLFFEAFRRVEGGAGEGEREREGEEDKLYVFLSIFKFEERKGWKELMSAFTQEFSKKKDKVLLLVVSHTDNDNMKEVEDFLEVPPFSPLEQQDQDDTNTYDYHNYDDYNHDGYNPYYDDMEYYEAQYNDDFQDGDEEDYIPNQYDSYLEENYEDDIRPVFGDIVEGEGEGGEEEEGEGEEKEFNEEQPVVLFLRKHLTADELVSLYSSVDAFVLPSRGEGWGRPLIEAMSMSLPVISTNWSGLTEFMTAENSYLLPVEEFIPANKDHLWALPSVPKLKETMRYLYENKDEGRNKGKKAREDILKKFSPKIMAEMVVQRVEMLIKKEEERQKENREKERMIKEEEVVGFPCLSRRVRIQKDEESPSFPHPFQGEYPYHISP